MSPALDSPAPKPRNKLRKLSKRRPGSIVSSVSPRGSTDSRRESSEANGKQVPSSPRRESLACPPDLSDPKWQEYVRRSGVIRPMETSPQLKHTRSCSPSKLIPELAHLAVRNAPSTPQSDRSVEDLPPPLPSSPHSTLSTSASASMRRYAKTPVLRIGQLEGCPEADAPPPPPPVPVPPIPARADRSSNVERMAEQYRALLDARSYESLRADAAVQEDDSSFEEWHDAEDHTTRQNSIETIRSAVTRRRSPLPLRLERRPCTPPPLLAAGEPDDDGAEGSPTSDGTLVDFEEDAIYFKPAFSPEALSPIPEYEDGMHSPLAATPASRPDALSLQICMDLLTRELMSALRRNRPQRGSPEVPPLQVWLMIEAYEKLRDRTLDMQLPMDQERALDDMLSTWLGALYRVHEELAEQREAWSPSQDEVEALQSVDLD